MLPQGEYCCAAKLVEGVYFSQEECADSTYYCEEIKVLKAGVSLNRLAWNNRIGRKFYFVGYRMTVMINRDSWGH